MMKTTKKSGLFEVVSHEKAVQIRQENGSRLFEVSSTPLPKADLKDAQRALETVPVTNKYYRLQLQAQIDKEKAKEKAKKQEEALRQMQTVKNTHEDEKDDGLDL